MKSLLSFLALGILSTSLAHAGLPVNESLTESVTEKFSVFSVDSGMH